MHHTWKLVVAALAASSCATPNPAQKGPDPAPSPVAPLVVAKKPVEEAPPAQALDPGAALIARERDVWSLEGVLLSEADAALRAPEAKTALGKAPSEAAVRGYLRTQRSAAERKLALSFLDAFDAPTRALLEQAAKEGAQTPGDLLMDYLTYDGLHDLAAMRQGYRRWKAGKSEAELKKLADSFFAQTTSAPSAKLGIQVRSASERLIEVDIFGCRITEAVHTAGLKTVGASVRGLVTWSSNYEQLRQAMRGARVEENHSEELEPDGPTFHLDYRRELTEYLAAAKVNAWAVELYAVPADELADLHAGPAAAAGLEHDPAKPAAPGWIGGAKGLRFEVTGARKALAPGEAKAGRGAFAVVTVKMTSKLPAELRVPGSWFHLQAEGARFDEVGPGRPALAGAAEKLAGKGTRALELPFALLGKKPLSAVLVFEVPAELASAKLVLGEGELELPVALK
ncbi:MAG: hypothetical protein ACYC8T_05575 [Myxococcaceae bacterium]